MHLSTSIAQEFLSAREVNRPGILPARAVKGALMLASRAAAPASALDRYAAAPQMAHSHGTREVIIRHRNGNQGDNRPENLYAPRDKRSRPE